MPDARKRAEKKAAPGKSSPGKSTPGKPAFGKPAFGKPTAADYRALVDFRYALRQFLDFSQTAAREVGLTPRGHQALLQIMGSFDRTSVTVGELAERLLLKHHSTVELVDRLAQLDLVRRAPDAKDRRKVLLSLTAKAEDMLNRLSAVHLEELRRIRPVFAGLLERIGG